MKSIYKKIIFIISTIALFSVIVGVVKYSLSYIENNPEKYLPKKNKTNLSINSQQKSIICLKYIFIDSLSHENQKYFST